MNSSNFTPQQIKAARVTAIASLVMAAAAIYADMGVRLALYVPGDALQTAQNILSHANAFRWGLIAYAVVLVCDLLAAWGYAAFFTPVQVGLARLSAAFRVGYTVIFGVAILQLALGLQLLNAGGMAQAEEAQAYFGSFDRIWQIGFLLFSLHLLLIGYLGWRSGTVPKLLSGLLLAAGVGYGLQATAFLGLPNYADVKAVLSALVAIPSIFGELGMAIWMLLRVRARRAHMAVAA